MKGILFNSIEFFALNFEWMYYQTIRYVAIFLNKNNNFERKNYI